MDEKVKQEIANINKKFDESIIELKNVSAVDEQTFKRVTTKIDDKVDDLKEFIDKKLRRIRDMTSSNSVIPTGDVKVDELQNSIKELNNNFKKFQAKINEDIINMKSNVQDPQNLFVNAELEANSKSRSKFTVKPDSPKKTNKSIKKSTIENIAEDIKNSEFGEYEKESSPHRVHSLEDELGESMERPLDEAQEHEEQEEHEEDEEQKENVIIRLSKQSSIQNQKIADQIDILMGKEMEQLKKEMRQLTNLWERLKIKVIDNAKEVQINRE